MAALHTILEDLSAGELDSLEEPPSPVPAPTPSPTPAPNQDPETPPEPREPKPDTPGPSPGPIRVLRLTHLHRARESQMPRYLQPRLFPLRQKVCTVPEGESDMRRQRRKKLGFQDLKAAGVPPKLVVRRVRRSGHGSPSARNFLHKTSLETHKAALIRPARGCFTTTITEVHQHLSPARLCII
jgi:hypothetical protein